MLLSHSNKMKRHKIFLLLCYTACLTGALLLLSPRKDVPVIRNLHDEMDQVDGWMVKGTKSAKATVRLIEAKYYQSESPEKTKDI